MALINYCNKFMETKVYDIECLVVKFPETKDFLFKYSILYKYNGGITYQ